MSLKFYSAKYVSLKNAISTLPIKFSILSFIMAMASVKSPCQIDIVNTTALVKSDSAIIFRFIRDPNILKVTGISNGNSLQIKASRLLIEKTKEPFLFHTKTTLSGSDTFYLFNAGKVVFKKVFQLVKPELIKAQLGSITDSMATISKIISYPFLRVVIPNCNCFPSHVTGGFTVKFTSTHLEPWEFTVKFTSTHLEPWEKEFDVSGGKLTSIINVIRKLQPKDKISFDNIRTIDIDSSPLRLAELTITIK